MSDPTAMPEALAQAAEAAEEERKRQQDSGGGDVAADVAGSVLDGTLSAMMDGAVAVGEVS